MGKLAAKKIISGKAASASSKKTSSPFDLKVNKPKFQVVNKNVIGAKGNPGQSKSKSLKKRVTLATELKQRGRTGEFNDKRFGERNKALSSEDKMMERFSRERARVSKKKAVFNLNDTNEHASDFKSTLTLTHRGRNLDDMDEFDHSGGLDDEDYGYDQQEHYHNLDAQTVSESHFGGSNNGNSNNNTVERSRAEIMQEVIAKSKMHKFQRQKMKEENELLCEDLDATFDQITSLTSRPHAVPGAQPVGDNYNEVVRALSFERRVKPGERVKSEEEIAISEAKKVKTAIEERKKRQLGEEDEYQVSNESAEGENEDEEEMTDAERSLLAVMKQVEGLYKEIMQSTDLNEANTAFAAIAALSKTNSVIPVARVMRKKLQAIIDSLGEKKPTMPSKDTLLLFHIIGLIFSTSDYHHIVVTPAMHLMCYYLENGRLLKPVHILNAFFIMQTLMAYTKESGRICFEVYSLLYPLCVKLFALEETSSTHLPSKRLMSKSLTEFLDKKEDFKADPCLVRMISFDDLNDNEITKEKLVGFATFLIESSFERYSSLEGSPELLTPFLPFLSAENFKTFSLKINQLKKNRKPLEQFKRKPIAIPSLLPELEAPQSKDEKESVKLKRAYKREYKGAKRELKRDSAFLADYKLKEKVEGDRKYKEKMRQIVGSIANESNNPERKKRSFSKR